MGALERDEIETAVELAVRTWVDGPERAAADVDDGASQQCSGAPSRSRATCQAPFREESLVPELPQRLDEITVPTLAVAGALDLDRVREQAARLGATITAAELAIIPDAAHTPTVEQPLAFDSVALPFLERITAHRLSSQVAKAGYDP